MPYIFLKGASDIALFHEIPFQQRLELEENLIERQQRLFVKSKGLNSSLEELRKEYKLSISELIGKEKYRLNLAQYEKICKQFAETPESSVFTKQSEKREQERLKRLANKKHKFYHSLGINIQKAIALRKETFTKVKAAIAQHIDLELEAPTGEHAEEPKPTSNPWTWYTPPYAHHWNNISYSGGSAGNIWKAANSYASTGEINLMSWIQLYGADDSDWLKTDVMCEVGFWFKMPAAGILEVWAWFQDINTDYTGFLNDESGCSDADVHQLSRLYLWTKGSTERYIKVVDYHRGEDEGSWSNSLTLPGNVISKHFFSQKAYAAGEWVYASIGVRDYNYFWVDDMSCRSRMYSQWFVKQVAVRSTGAP